MSSYHHSDFVQILTCIYQPKVYLELGLYEGETWNKVTPFCQRKIGVDIVDRGLEGEVYIETTDSFFSKFHDKIDMAFIDADHKYESCKQDFLNCYERLNEGGVIIMHDTDPENESLFSYDRCGDSYKVVNFLEKEFYGVNIVTLPLAEAGISVITKKQSTRTQRREKGKKMFSRPHTFKHNAWTDDFTIQQLKSISPSSVVDIGCGDGFYGKLCKYVLGDNVSVIGVDANPKWYEHCNSLIEYEKVIHSCILDALPQLKGELVIAGDVLEHLEEVDMRRVVKHLVSSFKYVIINSPLGFQPQDHADTWEHHRCGLDKSVFDEYSILEYNESSHMGNEMFNILLGKEET